MGVLEELERVLGDRGVPFFTLLLSEVSPDIMISFKGISKNRTFIVPAFYSSFSLRYGVPFSTVLSSEVSPERLALFRDVDAWVQVACPRLSLDWGEAYEK